MKGILLSSLAVAVLCLMAAPVRADLTDLFSFTINNSHASWDNGSKQLTVLPSSVVSSGSTTRLVLPTGNTAVLDWPKSSGSFSLVLNVSGNTASGPFSLMDIDGDTITGTVSGQWVHVPVYGGLGYTIVGGALSNVTFSQTGLQDKMFDGNSGSVSLSFPGYTTPWGGSMTVLTGLSPGLSVPWSGMYASGVDGGTVGGVVSASPVPIPAAVLLGFLGLSAAGLGLRKLA